MTDQLLDRLNRDRPERELLAAAFTAISALPSAKRRDLGSRMKACGQILEARDIPTDQGALLISISMRLTALSNVLSQRHALIEPAVRRMNGRLYLSDTLLDLTAEQPIILTNGVPAFDIETLAASILSRTEVQGRG